MSRPELEEVANSMFKRIREQEVSLEQLRQDFKDAMRLVRTTNFNQEKNDAAPQQHQHNT